MAETSTVNSREEASQALLDELGTVPLYYGLRLGRLESPGWEDFHHLDKRDDAEIARTRVETMAIQCLSAARAWGVPHRGGC